MIDWFTKVDKCALFMNRIRCYDHVECSKTPYFSKRWISLVIQRSSSSLSSEFCGDGSTPLKVI